MSLVFKLSGRQLPSVSLWTIFTKTYSDGAGTIQSNKKDSASGSNTKLLSKKDLASFRKTPIGKLDELEGKHPYAEKEPLPEFKDGVNPETGEVGGPKGPEPTRYGDWERKGRVSDF